jgi:hypothetical protein
MGLSSEWSLVNSHWSLGKVFRLFCLVSCFLVLGSAESKAQTFAEWFDQKSTLIKYLTKQIAYVRIYEQELKQGYQQAKNDWGLVRNWKNGELSLHSDEYSSLAKVNPQVLAATDVNSIRSEAWSITAQFSGLKGLRGLSQGEQAYVSSVADGVIGNCNRDLGDLSQVLTSDVFQMTDAERIERIKRVAASVRDEYLFTCSFCGKVRSLVMLRNGESRDSETIRRLYGID